MKPGKIIGCALAFWVWSLLTANGHADSVLSSAPGPGCYRSVDLERPAESAPHREIVIALDQTTVLPEKLMETLLQTAETLVVPGNRISVAMFSAYSSQHHLHRALSLEIELPPPELSKRKMPIIKTRALKRCLELQVLKAKRTLRGVITSSMPGTVPKIARSEIINAMRMLAPRLAEFAGAKILVMVSDGLEHAPGATTSFYRKQQLRHIDPAREFAIVKSKQLLARLDGVQVYFFGGAISPDEHVYRDQDAVTSVARFWDLYVTASGGTLAEFGTPELQSLVVR